MSTKSRQANPPIQKLQRLRFCFLNHSYKTLSDRERGIFLENRKISDRIKPRTIHGDPLLLLWQESSAKSKTDFSVRHDRANSLQCRSKEAVRPRFRYVTKPTTVLKQVRWAKKGRLFLPGLAAFLLVLAESLFTFFIQSTFRKITLVQIIP